MELAEKTLAQFRANIDSMSEGMYVVDTDGKRLLTNPAYFRILGFDPGSSPDALSPLLERYDMNDKLIPAEDWSVSRALRGETVVQRQLRVRRSDTGREVIVRVNATPVRDSSGNVTMAVGTVEDITAMKQAEESLRTSEKLAAVGRMAGTLAHEINNPLDAVNNLVYLLSQDLKLDEHGHECVQLLQRELERMQQIVANTLSFYRDSSSPVQVNLSQVLDSVLTLDARKIDRKRLQVRKRIEGNVSVMGFPGELRQVFLNLVSNAIEATPDEGTLRIHIFPSKQWQKEEVQGVRVVIADNGHGISSEQRSKLFQPFFTTKGEEGTGLGLWVSQGIVRKHQGEICLRSTTRFGRSGTCFSVFLPMGLPETKQEETTDTKKAS
jgi:two-component system CheB/CheR fusion protein